MTDTPLRHAPGPYFGEFGGRFVPESLIAALDEIDVAWQAAKNDPEFLAEFERLSRDFSGRPSLLSEVPRFAEHCGGARILLKREDLNHTGSHKINNVVGQALLTKRLGKKRVIAETGAGQHGVATATAAALFGLECTIYMGAVDIARQALNVARMRLLGAEVISVASGSRTLKDAINEAFRDWVANVEHTNYVFGTAAGPHPFPALVRDLQQIVGEEARAQAIDQFGGLPDAVVACVGGGSNAIGIFEAFLDDPEVKLYGIEAAGEGIHTARTAATIETGRPGVLHGARTMLLQDADGQTIESHSISAGLDYPGVGPQHSWLNSIGRVEYRGSTDAEAMVAMRLLSQTEGIIPAIESAHALAGAMKLGRELGPDATIIVSLSGRGDKDMETAMTWFELGDANRVIGDSE
ncbi:tryptophan synthase subunit beta [Gulosibacter macacae]|uniref:Tryptophan synthase beta chain n=1 Tax=Gulosibacter macacae TaxID=2488791 RepID=A0A3P3VYX1_9MICO|nr:tryptophan synthase subunit beta [Gulosibacter macacae]RRJ87268.1 tryptophan synthase subunit beta [Gulosibacter macacae]